MAGHVMSHSKGSLWTLVIVFKHTSTPEHLNVIFVWKFHSRSKNNFYLYLFKPLWGKSKRMYSFWNECIRFENGSIRFETNVFVLKTDLFVLKRMHSFWKRIYSFWKSEDSFWKRIYSFWNEHFFAPKRNYSFWKRIDSFSKSIYSFWNERFSLQNECHSKTTNRFTDFYFTEFCHLKASKNVFFFKEKIEVCSFRKCGTHWPMPVCSTLIYLLRVQSFKENVVVTGHRWFWLWKSTNKLESRLKC